MRDGAEVRPARSGEFVAVVGTFEAAMLEVDAEAMRARIDAGEVLVAVEDGRVLGALALDGREVTAVAVRPGRRDSGIGTVLLEAAIGRVEGHLTAEFDERVRPFYESLGFEIEPIEDEEGRYRGRTEVIDADGDRQ